MKIRQLSIIIAFVAMFAGSQLSTVADAQSSPTSATKRVKGTVKWFNDAKGIGYITSENGTDIFFTKNSADGRFAEGECVTFEIESSPKGPVAERVRGCPGAKPATIGPMSFPFPQSDAPTLDAIMELEKQAVEASSKGDSRFFEGVLSDKFIARPGRDRIDKTAAIKMIISMKCDVKSYTLDEPSLTKIDTDTYVSIHRKIAEGTCTDDGGKSVKIPSPVRTATVWVRSGDKWLSAFHGANLIVDPKDARAAIAVESEAQLPNATTALAAIETSVWEAWKSHDREKIEAITADTLAFVDIFGNAYANRADIINAWSGSICKVQRVAVTDAIAFSLSPTVKLLTHTGSADGTCYGAKIGPIYGNSLYVRDGKSWKLAFTMNMPAM